MSIGVLVNKYIISTEKALKDMKQTKDSIKLDETAINEIVAYAKDYLEDAKYYTLPESP